MLGLAMVPGNHIVSVEVDTSRSDEEPKYTSEEEDATTQDDVVVNTSPDQ